VSMLSSYKVVDCGEVVIAVGEVVIPVGEVVIPVGAVPQQPLQLCTLWLNIRFYFCRHSCLTVGG
jgi:hypothetical protein